MDKTNIASLLQSFLQGTSNSAAAVVSVPVDSLAWMMRKAGAPIPENALGGSNWMTQQGLTRAPQNTNAGLVGEAVGGVLPTLAAAKGPQIGAVLQKMVDNAATPAQNSPQLGGVLLPFSEPKRAVKDVAKLSEIPQDLPANWGSMNRAYPTLEEGIVDAGVASQHLKASGVAPGARFTDNFGGRRWVYDVVEMDDRTGLVHGIAREFRPNGVLQQKFALPPEQLLRMEKHELQPGKLPQNVAQRFYGGENTIWNTDNVRALFNGLAKPKP